MLTIFFGFGGRLSRLQYFLGCLAQFLAIVVFAIFVATIAYRGGHTPSAMIFVAVPMLVAIPVVLWISLSMQVRRLRDMGWNPIVVMPAWILVCALDPIAASLFPNLFGGYHQTPVGIMVNLGLTTALFFWPSADEEWSPPTRSPERSPVPDDPAPERFAMDRRSTIPARVGFGRRGLPQ